MPKLLIYQLENNRCPYLSHFVNHKLIKPRFPILHITMAQRTFRNRTPELILSPRGIVQMYEDNERLNRPGGDLPSPPLTPPSTPSHPQNNYQRSENIDKFIERSGSVITSPSPMPPHSGSQSNGQRSGDIDKVTERSGSGIPSPRPTPPRSGPHYSDQRLEDVEKGVMASKEHSGDSNFFFRFRHSLLRAMVLSAPPKVVSPRYPHTLHSAFVNEDEIDKEEETGTTTLAGYEPGGIWANGCYW
jgi:hypothetical protein